MLGKQNRSPLGGGKQTLGAGSSPMVPTTPPNPGRSDQAYLSVGRTPLGGLRTVFFVQMPTQKTGPFDIPIRLI